jgi:hypothetical protein
MAKTVKGKKQMNLPGKAKKPQSANYGMTKAPGSSKTPMKKGSSSKKSGASCL